MDMDELKAITEKLDRLRIDLAATNMAVAAISTVLTPEQRKLVLARYARASAEKQHFFEQLPSPTAQAAMPLVQEAEDRIYRMLQEAPTKFRD